MKFLAQIIKTPDTDRVFFQRTVDYGGPTGGDEPENIQSLLLNGSITTLKTAAKETSLEEQTRNFIQAGRDILKAHEQLAKENQLDDQWMLAIWILSVTKLEKILPEFDDYLQNSFHNSVKNIRGQFLAWIESDRPLAMIPEENS